MSYLHLNGYPIPLRHASEVTFEEVAPLRGYSFNGSYQFGRNGIARAWRCLTAPLPRQEAVALAAMINMRGDAWRWPLGDTAPDGVHYITANTDSFLRTDERRIARSGEAKATLCSAYGADGARVYDWNGNAYAPFSGCEGSVLVEPGTTNILSTAESNPESGSVGWLTSSGSTVTATTDHYWRGSGSANVSDAGASRSAISSAQTVAINTDYVFSTYVKPPVEGFAGETIPFRITSTGDSSGATQSTNTTLSAGYNPDGWYRIYHTFTTDGSDTTATITITCFSTNTDFQIDGGQLEVDVNGGFPTAYVYSGDDPWGSGNGVRPAGELDYDEFVSGYTNGITISAWMNFQRKAAGLGNKYIFDSSDGVPKVQMYLNDSNQIVATVVGSSNSNLQLNPVVLDTGIYHLVLTYDPKTATMRLYSNGALIGSDSSWSGARQFFDIENNQDPSSIGTAGSAGANTCPGPIGPVQLYPFAMPLEMVSGMYSSGADDRPVPGVLPLAVHGDVLSAGEKQVYVYGKAERVRTVPHAPDATGQWEDGAAEVQFILSEDEALIT